MELVPLAALAFVAGVVSFSSPCMLPLLPGYAAFVGAGPSTDRSARRLGPGPVLFTLGFGGAFTVLGAVAASVGGTAGGSRWLDVGAGVVIVVMAALLVTGRRPGPTGREVRPWLQRAADGGHGAFSLGVAFAVGWTPCVGPVLAGILTLAGRESSVARGALLLAVYAAGMGLPFLFLARAVAGGRDRFGFLRRHGRHLEVVGGVVLGVTGVLMVTGVWTRMMSSLLAWYARFGWPPI